MQYGSVKYKHYWAIEKEAIGFALGSWGNAMEDRMFDVDLGR